MKTSRLIAVDIGNTTLSLGLFEADRLTATARIPAGTAARDLAQAWPAWFPPTAQLADVVFVASSVNPPALGRVETSLGARLLLVRRDMDIPMDIRLCEPGKVGADRLVNAYEAYARFRRAAVVVDMGTAITLDCVSADGAFLGGAIAPGARLGAAALHEHTALLPAIDIADAPPAMGADTVSAMQSGVFWGVVGAVRELLRRLLASFPDDAAVVATGGDGLRFAPHISEIQSVVPDLTLWGLYRIYHDAPAGR